MKNKCTEIAKIMVPWDGKILSYCPVHANQIVMLGNAMGSPLRVKLIPPGSETACESHDELTEEQKDMNSLFTPTP